MLTFDFLIFGMVVATSSFSLYFMPKKKKFLLSWGIYAAQVFPQQMHVILVKDIQGC